jgi:hypothetical protein
MAQRCPGSTKDPVAVPTGREKAGRGKILDLKLMLLRSVDFLEESKKSFYKPLFRSQDTRAELATDSFR